LSGTCGADGTCTGLLDAGDTCSANGECASGACGPDGTCAGKASGETCVADGECASLGCVDGTCAKGGGEDCTADSECASAKCGADGTCFYANGEACSSNAKCVSGACGTDGTCTGKDAGDTCAGGGECLSGTCSADGTCTGLLDAAPVPTPAPTPAPTPPEVTSAPTPAATAAGPAPKSECPAWCVNGVKPLEYRCQKNIPCFQCSECQCESSCTKANRTCEEYSQSGKCKTWRTDSHCLGCKMFKPKPDCKRAWCGINKPWKAHCKNLMCNACRPECDD